MAADRRQFLASTAGGLATLLAGSESQSALSESAPTALPIIDTHQHLWDLNRFHLPWLNPANPALDVIHRSFLPRDYAEQTQGLNIVRSVYMEVNVHAAQQQAEAETVISLCHREDNTLAGAVIGGSPHQHGFADYIEPLARHSAVRGVRMVLHDADRPPGLCLQSEFVRNMQRLGDLNLNFDLCMRPGEISDGAELARRCPGTQFVIDHCGNLGVQSQDARLRKKWEDGLKTAADLDNTFIKISGIVASASPGQWTADDLAPNINFCLDTFGEDRCVFGGDWPVCLLGASYQDWTRALQEIVAGRSHSFQQKLFHDNAVRIYRLG